VPSVQIFHIFTQGILFISSIILLIPQIAKSIHHKKAFQILFQTTLKTFNVSLQKSAITQPNKLSLFVLFSKFVARYAHKDLKASIIP